MTNLNLTKFLISALGVTVFTLVYGMFIQGHIGAVEATAISMTATVKALLVALVITLIFTKNYEDKGMHEGIRFGVLIGLLLGVVGATGHMDKIDVAVKHLIDGVLFGVGSGIVLSLLYKDGK
ncbi:MAG: hypothetical protein AB7G06_08390 [Bdellovibrionales bacterium]